MELVATAAEACSAAGADCPNGYGPRSLPAESCNMSPIGKAFAWLNAQGLVNYTGAGFEVNNWSPAGRACIRVRDAGRIELKPRGREDTLARAVPPGWSI